MKLRTKFFLLGSLGLGLDQGLKYFGAGFLDYYLNSNFAWSLPVSNQTVVLLTLPLLLLMAGFFYQHPPVGLIMAGAVSNLIDRLIRGGVVDYIHLPGGGVINLADILIFAGIVLLLIKWKHA